MTQSKYIHLGFFYTAISWFLLFITSRFFKSTAIDINVHDTYFVIGIGSVSLILAIYFSFFVLFYYLVQVLKINSIIIFNWIHLLTMILFSIFFIIMYNGNMYSNFITQSAILVMIITFVIAQLSFSLSLITSFILRVKG